MGQVRAVLGIPYANAGRFERPVRVPLDDFDRYTAFGPAPPQRPGLGLTPGAPVVDTDEHACLTLNVWAPARDADPLPVLVVFYGGGFVTGSSAEACYDGARIAVEQEVVVVSVNYRIGALGFLDLRPIRGTSANLGLLDAIAALRWVHDHISTLGGDPVRVTILGESAGGGMCLHLLASPEAQGLFTNAIVQSGVTGLTLDEASAALVLETFCAQAGTNDLDALLAFPVDAILDAQQATEAALLGSIGMMPFHPSVDGEIVLAPPAVALESGVAAGVPLLAGSTADEMRLYLDPNAPPLERDRLVKRVARFAGASPERAEEIVAVYEAETDDVWPAVFQDVAMQLPLRHVLDAQSAHAPTYTYLFAWEAPTIGAAHAVDIPFILGNFVEGWAEFVGYDADAERLSRVMRETWASFARTGDPRWPAYPAVMTFDRDACVAETHPFTRRLDALAG
ncbi:MAG: carboxylesterase family protein [Actinomycetota bacterium]|nr:carboxylesterase family protein [Actinomycetota bacterium]